MPSTQPLYLILIPLAYLLGSVPTGIVVSRAFGKADPRTAGSRNIGATNVGRTSGKAAGVLTLAGDIIKGALPAYIALLVEPDPVFVSLVALAAFIGHLFPIYLRFRGGKGVATACGVMLVISPIATLLSGAVFLIAVLVKRYVSLGSMLASVSLPVFLSFIRGGKPYVPMGIIISVLIIIKHTDNIRRLAAGKENKIRRK